jgi:hypothetical protein
VQWLLVTADRRPAVAATGTQDVQWLLVTEGTDALLLRGFLLLMRIDGDEERVYTARTVRRV